VQADANGSVRFDDILLPFDRDLFRDGEVVSDRVFPVDEVDGDGLFAEPGADSGTIAKEAVDVAVGVVQGSASAETGRFVQLVQSGSRARRPWSREAPGVRFSVRVGL